jgi:4-diphosphocytidyl-2-C-methyl-D-erythritol kinase
MAARPVRMEGIGDVLTPVPDLPDLHIVLVNPNRTVSTAAVFGRLASKMNPPMTTLPSGLDAPAFADWLAGQRNDLEPPAVETLPLIGDGLAALRADPACLLARMSGSGATCFGLFETAQAAHAAATRFGADHPGWWVRSGPVLTDDQSVRATT